MNIEGFDWRARPDADALLTELWPTNKHIQDILAEIRQRLRRYTITKNALCGRAKRLGLPTRRASERKPEPKRPHSRNRVPVRASAPTVPPAVHHDPVTLAAANPPAERLPPPPPLLSRPSCMWPIGEPREKDFRFCGEPAVFGKPYCPVHSKTAYRGKPAPKSIDKNADSGENLNVPYGA